MSLLTPRFATEEAAFRPALALSLLPGVNGTQMMEVLAIPRNVWDFIHKASEDVGRIEADRFGQDMHGAIVESHRIASPIEQIFLVALSAMARAHLEPLNPEPIELNGRSFSGRGIHISSQFPVDKYRVDFLIQRMWLFDGENCSHKVIVELDGHEFHDKDKRQRSYEKARDRHLARKGFKVLHYTGSDLVADPYAVAFEVMDTIECFGPVGSEAYNKADPLSQGY